MANRYRNLIYSTAEYTNSYGGFRGVELNAASLVSSRSRLAYAENMYKDYDGDGSEVIESIPGFRCFANYGQTVHAIYYQRSMSGNGDHLIVHVGSRLMRHPVSDINTKSSTGTQIATLENTKSFGFAFGRYYYVLDSVRILQIDESGNCKKVGDSGSYPYVPTTYVSGEAYEQRNLLINDFKEEYYIADPRNYLHKTDGIKFTITDPYQRFCSVSGISDSVTGEVYLPSYINITGVDYKVTAIDAHAFAGNTKVGAIYISDGIKEIGSHAFADCTSLCTVVTSPSVEKIKDNAFKNCSMLSSLYLGVSVAHVGENALYGCTSLQTVNYALDADKLNDIDGSEIITAKGILYNSRYEQIKLSLPFHGDVDGITKVTVNGSTSSFSGVDNGTFFTNVIITFPSIADATGVNVTVRGTLAPLGSDWLKSMAARTDITPYKAIAGCTTAEVFDGRIFLSGNPALPNTVFYTERPKPGEEAALYVGIYDYFNDGVGNYKVKDIMAVRDMLAIFKEGDDGSGSIFYHKKEGTSLGIVDTVYPVAYVHSGICSSGNALSFLDDPVFLTKDGLMALNGENINYQRNVVCRSHNVNYALLKEDLSKANLCEWLGYLVLGVNGRIFLADSRATFTHPAGSREYEWFMLTDIGAYTGDHTVYRYADEGYADSIAHPTLIGEEAPSGSIYSQTDSSGTLYYYVLTNGVKYRVVPTEERGGGTFHPATEFISHGKHLFFATDSGQLCVFNNDKRGVAPDSIKAEAGFSQSEYNALMGNRIHPLFYSFAGHTPTYTVKTPLDNCGIPHLTKNTVKKSLVIKAKSACSDSISCTVSTDSLDPVLVGTFPAIGGDFENFDFSVAPWYVGQYSSYALSEREKRWIEKQITLTSSTFASPISLYSISYRYTIKGRIKNNS